MATITKQDIDISEYFGKEKGTVIYNSTPLYESEKIFSRNILIDYNNYVTDYDRYRIELMLATSDNGFYYYYTYLL